MILHQNVSKSSQFSRKIYITNISIVKNTIEENEKVIKSQSLSPKAPENNKLKGFKIRNKRKGKR